jgi:hypothetical protein
MARAEMIREVLPYFLIYIFLSYMLKGVLFHYREEFYSKYFRYLPIQNWQIEIGKNWQNEIGKNWQKVCIYIYMIDFQ